jgi:HPt (histidine-containing phosphotransfer) domain-containing protein
MLLDLNRAKEFAFDPEQLRELVASFELSLGQEMAVIDAALEAQNAQKVELALHALKGFMPLFTGAAMAQAITDLYQTSRVAPLAQTQAAYTVLQPDLVTLLSEVRAWLGAL